MVTNSLANATPPQVFDVFLSYNSREKKVVERLAERLKREALKPWFDAWCLTLAGDWQDELADGLRRSSSCAVFVGPGGIGDWERLELKLATDRMAKDRKFRVFMVLLPDLEAIETLSLPPFLSTRTWVDMRKGLADSRAVQMLINAVKGLPPGPETPIASRDDVCPFRGLRSFYEEHAEFFFGREGEVQRLVEKMKSTRFLTVLGPSGSGKSSVVRAGLLPALRKGALSGSDTWSVRVFRPGESPLTQLVANLVRLDPRASAAKLLDELNAEERTLHLASSVALAEQPQTERVVWVVDQFEEVFTLCRNKSERKQFISNLLYAAAAPGGRCVVVLTMRADFYHKCAVSPELSAQVSAQQFLLSPMSTEGLRQAIAEPAWRVGLEFEPGLVETILGVVEGEPGALPLLEDALLELWERRRGRILTLEAYRETGGVEGAIAKRAERLFESFDSEQQAITRRMMLRLTQPGEGTGDTRRRAILSELVRHPDEAEKVRDVVTALADARLLTTDRETAEGPEVVDVSHEVLIRTWPSLRRWVDEDRQGLLTHRRLTDAADEWRRLNRDEGLLFRGARLAETKEWSVHNHSALNELEQLFLDTSAELAERERSATQRRTRRVVVGLVIALVSITAASIYGLIQNRLAARQRKEVFARELAANAMTQLAVNPELGLLLAIEAATKAATTETEDALRQALVKSPVHVLHVGARADKALFSPDAKRILTISEKTAQVWDTENGQKMFDLSHESELIDGVYSPDGRLIATFVQSGMCQIWDAVSGQMIIRWKETGEVNNGGFRLTFSADSKYLLVDDGSSVRVRETNGVKLIAQLPGSFPQFTRDGALVLRNTSNGSGDLLNVFDPKTWNSVAEMASRKSREESVFGALGPDGQFVVKAAENHARIYQLGDKRLLGEFELRDPKLAEFSADGKLLATASGRVLEIRDVATGAAIEFSEAPGPLDSISFSPDGRFLMTTADVARLYDVKSPEKRLISEFGIFRGAFGVAAEFSSDSKYVLTANADGTVFLWDLDVWRSPVEIKYGRDEEGEDPFKVFAAAFSPDGKFLLTSEAARSPRSTEFFLFNRYSYKVRVRELGGGRTVNLYTREKVLMSYRDLRLIEISQDGRLVLAKGNNTKTVRIWEVDSGRIRADIDNGKKASHAAFRRDGNVMALVSDGSAGKDSVAMYDVNDGHLLDEFEPGMAVTSVAFSPDGSHLLLTGIENTKMWEIGGKRNLFETHRAMRGGAFSADGKLILTWGDTATVLVMDAATGRIISDLRGHVDTVNGAAFSPDGKYVVTVSGYDSYMGPAFDIRKRGVDRVPNGGNEVRIWEVSSGNTIYEFKGYNEHLIAARFNSDVRSVQVYAQDGTLLVYTCEVCKPQAELLEMAAKRGFRQLTDDERARYLHE